MNDSLGADLELPTMAGKAAHVPFGISDVGGELVSMLSEGLYGDPRDALREYVQNAVDAGTATVNLRFTGRDLFIIDQGAGMDFDDLVAARRIGKSSKSSSSISVGFRGIGVYAGFQICDRITISTRKTGSDRRWTLTFDFAAMRAVLLGNRQLSQRSAGSDIGPLISEHTSIIFQPADTTEPSGTSVCLEAISKAAYHELSEPLALKSYLRRTLPVGYNKKFEYRTQVEAYLRKRVPDYKTIRIYLKIDDLGIDEEITREFPEGLVQPFFIDAVWPSDSNDVRAIIWACHSARLKLQGGGGLFFRLKGFTIGDGRELREKFKRQVVFDWYIGEVHVIDPNVIPNVARNDFESNQARRDLYSSLDSPCEDLQTQAVKYQGYMRAVEVITQTEKEVAEFASGAKTTDFVEQYEKLGILETKLAGQRIPTKDIPSQAESMDSTRERKKALTESLKQLRAEFKAKAEGRADSAVREQPKEKPKLTVTPEADGDADVVEDKSPTVGDSVLIDGHWLEAVFIEHGWKLTAQTQEAMAVVAQAMTDAKLTTSRWRSMFVTLLDAILSRGS